MAESESTSVQYHNSSAVITIEDDNASGDTMSISTSNNQWNISPETAMAVNKYGKLSKAEAINICADVIEVLHTWAVF